MDNDKDINRLSSLLPQGVQGGLQSSKRQAAQGNSNGSSNKNKKSLLGLDKKNYRNSTANDTPSHPGGVDPHIVRRAEERRRERDYDRRTTATNGNAGGGRRQYPQYTDRSTNKNDDDDGGYRRKRGREEQRY